MNEKPITEIIGDIVDKASEAMGIHINYLWGDWTYISNQLTIWSKTPETARLKYPVVCLFSPFDEDKTDARYQSKAYVEMLIATSTMSDYTNEQREQNSFRETLRPIYQELIHQMKRSPYLDFDRHHVPHNYSENYRYGARGVMMSEGQKFNDFIDGIDIKRLQLKIKKLNCYGNRLS